MLAAICLGISIPQLRAQAPAGRGGGRGGTSLVGLSPRQQIAIGSFEQSMIPRIAALAEVRTALGGASVTLPRDEAEIRRRAAQVAQLELELALARAEEFDRLQSGSDRLTGDQLPIAIQYSMRALGGRGASANPQGVGPQAARAQAEALVAAPGTSATLFTSEPAVANPISIDIDARGRVWSTEGANYRAVAYTRGEGDRIMVFEDTDRDGAADRSTVFYQDRIVNAALGILVLDNRVIVTASPWVFVLTDTDGDTVADRRQVLFEDNSAGNHDHGFHALHVGPDGRLYFNVGNSVSELRRPVGGLLDVPLHGDIPEHATEVVSDIHGRPVRTDGAPFRQGMALRSEMDGTRVEVLGWNFRNPFELAVDSFGRLWQSDNDDDGNQAVRIVNIMRGGNYGFQDELTGAGWRTAWTEAGSPIEQRASYHWHEQDPGVAPTMLVTGAGSPTGIAVYEGSLLPAPFRGQVLHTDARPGVTRAYPIARQGAGLTAGIENLLTPPEGDEWYRPSDVAVAPDGSVYVADWSDATVGGHAMVDQVLATISGRIYRVAPAGSRPSVPTLDLQSAAGAVAALQSPNPNTHYQAWMRLRGMGNAAEAELLRVWQQRTGDDVHQRMRARALFLLARLGNGARHIDDALGDANEDIRIAALNAANAAGMDPIPLVRRLVQDPSAQVRREAALALHLNPSPAVPELWTALARQHDGSDRWYLEALGIGAEGRWDEVLPAWQTAIGGNVSSSAARDIIWRSRGNERTPGLVLASLRTPGTTAEVRARLLRALDFVSGPTKDAALLELLTQ